MDWNYAIERNRDALKRVLAALVAMAGLAGAAAFTSPLWGRGATAAGRPRAMEMALGETSARSHAEGHRREASGGGAPAWREGREATPTRQSDDCRPPHKGEVGSEVRPTLPRHLHRAVLRLLRPAESAARRLVIMAARGLVVPSARPRAAKPRPAPPPPFRQGVTTGIWTPPGLAPRPSARPKTPERPSKGRKPCLPLFDRLPRLGAPARPAPRGIPRLCVPGLGTLAPARPRPHKLTPDDPIDAARLHGRLLALARALDDLPAQARRYARWRMRAAAVAVGAEAQAPGPAKARRLWPLKPGRPPGLSRGPGHAVHEILRDAHHLALLVLDDPDTS